MVTADKGLTTTVDLVRLLDCDSNACSCQMCKPEDDHVPLLPPTHKHRHGYKIYASCPFISGNELMGSLWSTTWGHRKHARANTAVSLQQAVAIKSSLSTAAGRANEWIANEPQVSRHLHVFEFKDYADEPKSWKCNVVITNDYIYRWMGYGSMFLNEFHTDRQLALTFIKSVLLPFQTTRAVTVRDGLTQCHVLIADLYDLVCEYEFGLLSL